MRELLSDTRRKLSDRGQSLPPDTGDKLSNVELLAEKTQADLEDYRCPHCQAKRFQQESSRLTLAPRVLIVMLERYNREGEKDETPLSIPLVMKPYPDPAIHTDLNTPVGPQWAQLAMREMSGDFFTPHHH